MKLCLIVALLLACGCDSGCNGETVHLLNKDGSATVATCNHFWAKCVVDACPHGFTVIDQSSTIFDATLAKCNP